MNISALKPRQALNKAFLKVKPNRSAIEIFKSNLIALLDRTNDAESEEFHKNLVIDFLKKTYYDPNHFINTKGRDDLVIHNGNHAKSTVGVIALRLASPPIGLAVFSVNIPPAEVRRFQDMKVVGGNANHTPSVESENRNFTLHIWGRIGEIKSFGKLE
jgi:hypothetical protein